MSYFQTHANKLIIWIILASSFVQFLVVVVVVVVVVHVPPLTT